MTDPTLAAQIEALASVDVAYNGPLVALIRTNLPAIITALRQAEAAPGVVEADDPDALTGCADDQTYAAVPVETIRALARRHGAREDAHEPIRTSDPTPFAASDKTKRKSEKVRLPAAPATDVGEGA